MNEAYAGAGQVRTTGGGFLLATISLLATVLVIAGLIYATGIGARRKVLMAQGDCAPVPSLTQTGLDCTTEQQLDGQYTRLTAPAIQQLTTDKAAYAASEFTSLTAARAALMAQVTLSTSLDADLARFQFPAYIAPEARKLIQADEALIKLKAEQARSSTLARMRTFDAPVQAASAVVQADAQVVAKAMAKAPTASEEP